MSPPTDGSREQASDFLKPSGPEAQSGSNPPYTRPPHHYLSLKPLPSLPPSSEHQAGARGAAPHMQNRTAVIVNGHLMETYGPQAHKYRAIPFIQPGMEMEMEMERRTFNFLSKPLSLHAPGRPPRGWRRMAGAVRSGFGNAVVSKPPTAVRWMEVEQEVVDEPPAPEAFAVHKDRPWSPQHNEVPASPTTQDIPVIAPTRSTPPPAPASSMSSQPAQGSKEPLDQTARHLVLPPRRHHVNRARVATATPATEPTSQAKDRKERDMLAELAAAKEQIIFLRSQAGEKKIVENHYQMLLGRMKGAKESAKTQVEILQKQLEELKKIRTIYAEVRPISSGTSWGRVVSVKGSSSSSQRKAKGEVSFSRQTSLAHSASTLPRTLRSSRGRPRLENIFTTPSFSHNAPTTTSHGVLRPAVELADKLTFHINMIYCGQHHHIYDGWVEPPSYFSDDSESESDMDESTDAVERWLNELPAPRTLSENLAGLPSPYYRYPTIDSSLPPTSPPSSSCVPELSSPSSSDDTESGSSSENESESEGFLPTRPTEAIYRFQERRIEAVPAVFRLPIPQKSDVAASSVDLFGGGDDRSPVGKMHGWEWSSVPDLSLGDFGI